MVLESYDNLMTYCSMLGHQVPFSYCRRPGSNTPCSWIFSCRRGAIPEVALCGYQEACSSSRPKKSRMDMILQAVELAKSR